MKLELWGLLGLGGAVVLFLASPDAAVERETMRMVVAGVMTR